MKIVALGCTHGAHKGLEVPDGDVLIHTGDFMTHPYSTFSFKGFFHWFGSHPHKTKIVVPGNHDALMQTDKEWVNQWIIEQELGDIDVLIDESVIMDGVRFYGMPWTAPFGSWYFMKGPEAMKRKVSLIPEDTNVLITHGPPYGILDTANALGPPLGCHALMDAHREKRIGPDLHVFSHIHGGNGTAKGETKFANVSIMNEQYYPEHKPMVFEI